MKNHSLPLTKQPILDEFYKLHDKVIIRRNHEYPLYVLRNKEEDVIFLINNHFYDVNLIEIEQPEEDLFLYSLRYLPKGKISELLQKYILTNWTSVKR